MRIVASRRFFSNMMSLFVVTLFLISQSTACGYVQAAEVTATTKIKHRAVQYFVSGKRIVLNATVKDKQSIELVRCYFRSQGEADFVFVPMSDAGSGTYSGTLPAPSKSTASIDYLFLVVNSEKQVVKTQTYTVPKKEDDDTPAWQQNISEGDIVVNTEISPAPSQLAGFSDSIVIDVVESSARFGLVAGGLYAAGSSAAAGTTAATSAGTTTTSAGASTAVYIGAGVAVAAVAGVAAAAVASSSDDGEDDSSTDIDSGSPSEVNLEYVNGILKNGGDADITIDDITMTFSDLGYLYENLNDSFYSYDGVSLVWSQSGSDLVCSITMNYVLAAGEEYDLSYFQAIVDEYSSGSVFSLKIVVNTSSGTFTFQ